MFRSAVFKLTAAYLAIVMTICIAFSAVLYNVAVQEMQRGFHSQYTRWFNAYEPFGLRQPGTPTEEIALRSRYLLEQIFYFNLLVLLVTGAASYVLARRTLRPIEAAHEQQKRFTADVSHELRTPLTALKMETEVSLIDPKTPAKELRQTLRSNLEEVERMEVLINNLLLLSSMEANKLRTEFVPLDIKDILMSALGTVHSFAVSKHIVVVSKLHSKQVMGDQASLTQLFVILLENALKYSPEGSTVRVGILKGKGRVVVDIQDTGVGIPAGDLPHIFDRFYRADSARVSDSTPNTAQGFGLGLSLAKLIADLHGGEIILSSTPGAGTNAAVILPTNTK